MTKEQIDLEFAHMAYDKQLADGKKEQFEDDEFEAYDKETEEKDSRLSGIQPLDAYQEPPKTEEEEDDWEDVEMD